jgi:hypothetical protein
MLFSHAKRRQNGKIKEAQGKLQEALQAFVDVGT